MQARFRLPIKKLSKVDKPRKLQTSQESFHVRLNNYLFPTEIPDPPVTLVNYLLHLILQHHKNESLTDSNNDILALSHFFCKKAKSPKVVRLTANPWIAFRSYYSRSPLVSYFQQNDISTILSEYWANNASAREIWTMFSKRYKEENKAKVKAGVLVEDFRTWLNSRFGYIADYSPLDRIIQNKLELLLPHNNVIVSHELTTDQSKKADDCWLFVEDLCLEEALLENAFEATDCTESEKKDSCCKHIFRLGAPKKTIQNKAEQLNESEHIEEL